MVIFSKSPSHIAMKFTKKALEAFNKNLFPDDESIQETTV